MDKSKNSLLEVSTSYDGGMLSRYEEHNFKLGTESRRDWMM